VTTSLQQLQNFISII